MMSILHSIDKNEDFKVFNDSVHGHMQMHPLCVKIIDTPEFQRLRNIKQLGTTYLVYPGASHNRFEHSLGVCYLAGEMVDALTQNQHSLKINATDKLCVQIAGLCHDLGHGPFSHLWEHFLKKKGILWNHEEQSVKMFYHLLQENKLIDEFEKCGLDKVKRKFITELILGEGNSCDENKQFLFQIVCNQTNSIDVDKWDYFLRDGLHLNLKVSFDYRRLLKFCKVIEKEKDGKKKMHIAFRSKESYNIYEMFLVRSSLHYRAYQHRVSLAVNRMIIDALLAADEFYSMKLDGNFGLKLSEAHKNLNMWTRLTDNIFYDIIWKSSNDLATAQEILNRILYRRLYKFITSKKVFPTIDLGRKNENWLDDISRGLEEELNSKFKSVKFVVAYSSFYFGSNSPDPFKFVYFYDKNNPEEVEEKDWRDIALFPANKKAESAHHVEIYIFCKHPEPNSLIMEEAKAWTDHFIESFINNIA